VMTPDTVVQRALEVRARRVGDRHLVARGPEIVELNEVATTIWRLADGTRSVADIGRAVTQEYEIGAEQAIADVTEFLDEMVAAGFVVVAGGGDRR
jgi:hypothetical protein